MDWLMTNPHPWKRSHTHGADDGRIGWRWHAIANPTKPEGVDRRPAMCGLRPAHGWGGDLFADEMCERCRKAAMKEGIELPDWLQRSTMAVYKEQSYQRQSNA